MLKFATISFFIVAAIYGTLASAQTQTQASPGAGASGDVKALVSQCRTEAQGKGLKGSAKKVAINDCIAAQRPDIAARRECHQKAKAQNLSGSAIKAFVTQCISQSK